MSATADHAAARRQREWEMIYAAYVGAATARARRLGDAEMRDIILEARRVADGHERVLGEMVREEGAEADAHRARRESREAADAHDMVMHPEDKEG